MLPLRVFGVLLCFAAVGIACPYTTTITKVGPCANNKNPIVTLENFDIKLEGDDCKIRILGCILVKDEFKAAEVKYKVFKDGIPAISGSKQGCGFKEGDFEVKCPQKKNGKICPGKTLISVPGGAKALGMAKGKLKAQVDLVTDKGKFCYEGEGILKSA